MKDVAITVFLPIEDIVDALEPRVAKALASARSPKPVRRKNLSQALLNACEEMSTAYTRYENSLHTRDENAATRKVLVAATNVRKAFKAYSYPL